MATISGKRFQITDGASTPTNLFPYTVTEAVYGLSTVIENAKTAVTSVLSAVTLNGVSKAGTTASFYAPTTAGTAGQILTSLGSGAPAWTSVARGNSNTPIYINSSGVLTEGVSCLPLSAGASYPLTGALFIQSGNDAKIILDNTDADTNFQGISFRQNGTEYGRLGTFSVGSTNLQWIAGGVFNTIYHSGNSNKSDVAWSASSLTLAGTITGATNIDSLIYFDTTNSRVGIGNTSPGYKLDVSGSLGCSTLAARVSSTALILLEGGHRNNATEGGGIAFWKNSYHFGEINASVLALNSRSGGNVGIGTASPSQKLYVVGNIASTGDQVVSSDLTLKENLTPVTYSVSDIAKARAVEFDWRDGRGHSMGSIAQDWLGIAPALVHGEEGNMSLAYGQLALVNTILLARQSESHEERIKELEARVAELEMENERLRMN